MRLQILAAVGRLLGIQFEVDGLPYGTPYRPPAGCKGEITVASRAFGTETI